MGTRFGSDRSFRGAVAVVTGAGSGIGRALVPHLQRLGAQLAISDVDDAGLADTAALIAAAAPAGTIAGRTDHLDVVNRAAVLRYAGSVANDSGRVDLVINNAGVSHGGDVLGMSFEDLERVGSSDFFDRRLARTSAEDAAAAILAGAARGRARVLVGSDAKVVHFLAVLSNRGYQRAVAAGSRRLP